ncbi:hypothetical protein [Streptomyces sp. NPDC058735]|uniref:hypothetical protein n=1 Tax=unclassified Streptomyces TaxID=2593676 RepID=UPI0036BC7922
MPDHNTYGSRSHSADDLVRLLGARLGVDFVERESGFLGAYHLADTGDLRVQVQPHAIPGEDGDDLYEDSHPEYLVLVLTATPSRDPALRARLEAAGGLVHLRHEPEIV